jgi:integrase
MAQTKIQKGHLYRKGSGWHARFRELERQPDGTIEKVNRSQKIASVRDYPQKREVWSLFTEFMAKLNTVGFDLDASVDVRTFVVTRYLPWAEDNLATSTSRNYRQVWRERLAPRIGAVRVRDVRPVHIENVLVTIVRDNPALSKRTVQRAKALLSGIFTRAVALGLIDRNPVTEVGLPRITTREREMYAYTPDEIEQIVRVLPDPARTLCAIAAYAGLTASELRGLKWSDYDSANRLLYVRRGVWKDTVGETKTVARRKPVPVIAPLRIQLDAHARSAPLRGRDQWMFSSSVGTPVDLGNLVNRVIRPTLAKASLTWRGYHAFRRGLATILYSLNVPELLVQRILRHKPGSPVTRTHYIQAPTRDVLDAMETFERSIGGTGSISSGSPAVPQLVN